MHCLICPMQIHIWYVAHVHAEGKAYYAHAGQWVELVDTTPKH